MRLGIEHAVRWRRNLDDNSAPPKWWIIRSVCVMAVLTIVLIYAFVLLAAMQLTADVWAMLRRKVRGLKQRNE